MTRNMGTLDRGLRAFVVAPAAIVVAFVLGAGTVFGMPNRKGAMRIAETRKEVES